MSSRMKKSNLTSLTNASGNKKVMDRSLEEQAYEMEIHPIEAERLRKTFLRMCGAPVGNDKNYEQNESQKRQP